MLNNQEARKAGDHELLNGADAAAILSFGGWRSKLPTEQCPKCQKLFDQYMSQLYHYRNIQVGTLRPLDEAAQ